MIFSKKIDKILSAGFFLEDIGVNNWALDKPQCLEAIRNLKNINIAILGGDTFFDGKLNPTGDSWSCDKKDDENDMCFLERSVSESINFVCNPIYNQFKFVLMPKIYLE